MKQKNNVMTLKSTELYLSKKLISSPENPIAEALNKVKILVFPTVNEYDFWLPTH
jgi:hypothetical protein